MFQKRWYRKYKKYVLNGNIDAARNIVIKNAGQIKLYKFCSGRRHHLENLFSCKFYLSNAKKFNDPFDSLSLANVRSKSEYDRLDSRERELAHKEYLEQVESNNIAYEFQSNVFVTCFSEIGVDNLHMWSYYADEHKGFCIEYSLKQMLDAGIDILPIVYVDDWEADRTIPDYNIQVALIKGNDWAQEREWRIVSVDPSKSKELGKVIDGILPEAIYVGCREQEHIDETWGEYYDLADVIKDASVLRKYVWEGTRTRISINEIMDACENFSEFKIPLYWMSPAEGRIGLKKRIVKYLWKG